MNKIKYIRYSIWIFAVFAAVFSFWGYFKVGIISDTFGDAFTAMNSGVMDKITNNLQYIDPNRYRPVLFLSLQSIVGQNVLFNIPYDNFIVYKIASLLLYLAFAYTAGRLVLEITGDLLKAVITQVIILVFPNNLHNLIWTAAYFELLCGIFCLLSILYAVSSINDGGKKHIVYSAIYLALALLTKEIAVPLPFILILIVLIYYGYEKLKKNKIVFISQLTILVIYFISKTFLSKGIPVVSSDYFSGGFIGTSLQIIFKAFISLSVPGDYLVLKSGLAEFSIYEIIYILLILSAVIYYTFGFIKDKKAVKIITALLVFLFSIAPYVYAGYIRPQLILIPFTLMVISLISVFNISDRLFKYFLIIFIMLWTAAGYGVLNTWKTAYSKGMERVNNLLQVEYPKGNKFIVIGNPARLQQSFMFDNIMFPYNYFKYHDFILKDAVSDAVRTAALDEESLDSKIEVTEINKSEFDLRCTGKTQFFYLDGDDRKIKSDNGFKNDYMSAEYLEFGGLNKPVKIKVKFFTDDLQCYIFQGSKPEKLK